MKKVILLGIIALFVVSGCTLKLSEKPSSDPEKLTFAVIGDNEGVNEHFSSLMKKIDEDPSIEFILHVGDLTNLGSEREIAEIEHFLSNQKRQIPFYVVPGNHDIKEDADRKKLAAAFGGVPRSLDIKNMHLILLDNADRKIGFTDETLAWLEQDLAKVQNKKIIISFHRPFGYPLSETLGDDETTASRKSNERFKEIVAAFEISYIFTGHIHTNLEFPYVVERNEKNMPTKSIPVVVTGGGGQPPQDIFSSLFSPDYHYLKVTLTDGAFEIEKQTNP